MLELWSAQTRYGLWRRLWLAPAGAHRGLRVQIAPEAISQNPAHLATVGKRATLWMQDLVLDIADIDFRITTLPFRGVKGTTGTQASFLSLFDGDHGKVRDLDRRVTSAMGFSHSIPVSGQTYS